MAAAASPKPHLAAKKEPSQARARGAATEAALVAALAGLGPLARRARAGGGVGGSGGDDRLAERVLGLALAILEDRAWPDPLAARGAAEVTAAACCIGTDAFAAQQIQSLCDRLNALVQDDAVATQHSRAALCLALGAIFRAKAAASGPPPPGAVAAASDALFAVAARPVGVAPLWALQGLLCVAGAAGRGYAPRVRATLQLCQELLVSSAGDTPLLGVAAARLANAMVAVQGPDFSLGSPDYQRIRSLVTDRGALASDGQSLTAAAAGGPAAAAQAVWAALEQVLFAQALILFAPHAVPARKHMPLLLGTLASKRPALRRAAAATLRHLAEREPGVALEEGAEAHLLAALDSERDPQIAEQLRAAVALLLAAGAPAAPGRWLRLLSGVALAAPAAAGGAAAATPRQTGGGGGDRGGSGGFGLASMSLEGDDEDEGPWQGLPSAPPPSAPGGGGGHPHGSGSGSGAAAAPPPAMRTPRLRTRLFAAELLLALFPAVGPDPRHRTPPARNPDERRAPSSSAAALSPAASDALPSATTAAAASDWLVDHLQALVDSGFKLTTGGAEALRPAGARLLRRAVRFFAGVGDPDMPEALLLEQYQAQFVAALRAALTPGGPPALSISGGALATAFIECGLAANDGAVMRRLLDLLVAPLACWRRLAFPQYGEAVSVLARVALLQAHAQCCNIAAAATAGKAVAAAAGGGGGDGRAPAAPAAAVGELCASMVAKAQAPHRGMLCVLWGALLQDQAVITTLPDDPEAAARYRSILFGDASPATATAVAPCYEAAWPAVLAALSSALPPAAELAAARDAEAAAAGGLGDAGVSKTAAAGARDGWGEFVDTVSSSDGDAANAAAWEEQAAARALPVYRFLVNYALAMAAEQAGRAADAFSGGPATAREAGAAAQRAAAAMDALRVLLAPPLLTAGLAPPGTAAEAARMISAACYDALYPMAWSALVTKTGFVTGGGGASAANASPAPDSSPAATTTALIAVSEAAAGVAAALAEGLQAAAWEEDPGLGPALVEALLCLTSVTAPYCLLARGAAGPQFCPAADTGAAAAAAAAAPPPAGLVAAFAASLAAARRLLARRPLVPGTLKPLCEMGVRLLLTAAPGRQLTAAQAFFAEACMPAAAAAGGVEGGAAATAAADTLLAAVGEVLDPGTVSKQGQAGSGRLRLPALLSGLLASAATLCALNPADTTGSSEAVAALGALQRALSPGAPLWAQRAALEALRGTLQDAQADHHHHQQHQQAYGAGRKLLADKAAGAAAPAVAALVHAATRRLAAPLDGDGLAAAAEGLKVLLLVNNLAAARGGDAQAAVLSVLVPLLVQSAAPADGPPTPTLRDMALRLITAMPSAPTGGAAFRTALAALPAASKARLQAALRDSAAAAAAGGGAAAAAGGGARAGALQQPAKPAIQLKTTFALPKS